MTGSIRSRVISGRLPIDGVIVKWTLSGTDQSGEVTSDENGDFVIYHITTEISAPRWMLEMEVSKQSNSLLHTFACDSIACTGRKILAVGLKFDHHVEFTDTSTVAGVFIGSTEHSAFRSGCPLPNAKVCAYDHSSQRMLVRANTDTGGKLAFGVHDVLICDMRTIQHACGCWDVLISDC